MQRCHSGRRPGPAGPVQGGGDGGRPGASPAAGGTTWKKNPTKHMGWSFAIGFPFKWKCSWGGLCCSYTAESSLTAPVLLSIPAGEEGRLKEGPPRGCATFLPPNPKLSPLRGCQPPEAGCRQAPGRESGRHTGPDTRLSARAARQRPAEGTVVPALLRAAPRGRGRRRGSARHDTVRHNTTQHSTARYSAMAGDHSRSLGKGKRRSSVGPGRRFRLWQGARGFARGE